MDGRNRGGEGGGSTLTVLRWSRRPRSISETTGLRALCPDTRLRKYGGRTEEDLLVIDYYIIAECKDLRHYAG